MTSAILSFFDSSSSSLNGGESRTMGKTESELAMAAAAEAEAEGKNDDDDEDEKSRALDAEDSSGGEDAIIEDSTSDDD